MFVRSLLLLLRLAMAVPLYSISQTTLHPSPKLPPYPFPTPSTNGNPRRRSLSTSCTCAERRGATAPARTSRLSLPWKMERIRAQRKCKDEAMRKTKGILFSEICEHFGTTKEEMQRWWWKMDEEEKAGFAREFVGEWSVGFHPLSVKSVREMVDEHFGDKEASERSSGSFPGPGPLSIFSGLKRLIRSTEDTLERDHWALSVHNRSGDQ